MAGKCAAHFHQNTAHFLRGATDIHAFSGKDAGTQDSDANGHSLLLSCPFLKTFGIDIYSAIESN